MRTVTAREDADAGVYAALPSSSDKVGAYPSHNFSLGSRDAYVKTLTNPRAGILFSQPSIEITLDSIQQFASDYASAMETADTDAVNDPSSQPSMVDAAPSPHQSAPSSQTSPLLKLPPELRLQIYDHILPRHSIRLEALTGLYLPPYQRPSSSTSKAQAPL